MNCVCAQVNVNVCVNVCECVCMCVYVCVVAASASHQFLKTDHILIVLALD